MYAFIVMLLSSLHLCYAASSPVITFSTCEATGPLGPNQTQCNNAYGDSDHLNVFKLSVINGKQIIKIPFPGIFRLDAFGASGIGEFGGLGVHVSGEFPLPQGALIKILVGQHGEEDVDTGSYGGSGGTFVVRSATGADVPMLVGGGGASSSSASVDGSIEIWGRDASLSGGTSPGDTFGTGGKDGSGGYSGTGGKGGGGGGFKSGGQSSTVIYEVFQAEGFTSPESYLAGTGGRGHNSTMAVFSGGFGGGGYAFGSSAGGGGGYSGGGGASDGEIPGGGGSYVSGAKTSAAAENTEQGKVTLQFIDSGIQTTCSEHTFKVAFHKELVYGETEFNLEDASCTSTFNETHVIITSRLDKCNTRVSFENGSSTVHFKNTIKRSNQPKVPSRYSIGDINITCSYSISDVVTLNINPDISMVNFQPVLENGDFLVSTKAYRTIEYKNAYEEDDFPLKVKTDENIFLEVGLSIQMKSPDVVLQLDTCFASPSKNANEDPKHSMIDKDCEIDETLEFLSAPDDTTKRFLFKPVAFPAEHISTAFIHCEATLCKSTEGDCRKGCSRQKRHIVISSEGESDEKYKHLQAKSIGPFIVSGNSATIPKISSLLILTLVLSLIGQ